MKKPLVRASNGLKSGVVYTISTLFTRGLSIITVPIFTRLMSTEQIGIVNLYNSWYLLVSVVSTLSLTSGGFQLAMNKFEDKRDQYESSVLTITSLMSLVLLAIYTLFREKLNTIIGLPDCLIYLLIFGCFVSPAQDFWMARQRYEYKYKLSGSISFFTAIISSLASVVIVLLMANNGFEETASGRLIVNFIVVYGVASFFWIYIMAKGKTYFDREFWKFSLSLSLPLVGYSIAKQILDVSDRLMIDYFIGTSAVGIYGTLQSVSSISLVAWNAINASFIPYLFKNMEDRTKIKDISSHATLLLSLYSLIAVLMTLFAPEIVKILATDEYYESIYIMPPISAGICLTTVFNMYSNVLVYYKHTLAIMIPAIIAAVMKIILNFIFLPMYGYQAAAYTTLLSYIALAIMEGIAATRIYKKINPRHKMLYNNKTIVFMSIFTILISLISVFLYKTTMLRYMISFIALACIIIVYTKKKRI